ncbi:MAG: hypothetical protein BWY59_00067 [Verrucomicrobia bacterium ADurb.Bin345]|nr:MAG: hypothetical protein BWY59_00067 [Verrucomicrobia bacterium ADurb.Bin345]
MDSRVKYAPGTTLDSMEACGGRTIWDVVRYVCERNGSNKRKNPAANDSAERQKRNSPRDNRHSTSPYRLIGSSMRIDGSRTLQAIPSSAPAAKRMAGRRRVTARMKIHALVNSST